MSSLGLQSSVFPFVSVGETVVMVTVCGREQPDSDRKVSWVRQWEVPRYWSVSIRG